MPDKMTESTSNSIKSNVIGGVLTAGVLAIAGVVWAFAPGAWAWFTNLWALAWAYLTSSASLPMWLVYVLYIASAAWLIRIGLGIYSAISNKEPTFIEYSRDCFFGAIWRWHYVQGCPTGIWSFCQACDTVLVYSYQWDYGEQKTKLFCETCNRPIHTEQGDKGDLVAKVHRQIDRKIRNGEWKNYVERKTESPA